MEYIEELCQQLHSTVVEIKLVPDIASLRLLNYSTTYLDGMPIINLSISPMSLSNKMIKWLEDKVLASFILMAISPLLIVIAIGIKLTSKGPVFYRQERIGVNGKKFNMLKFRSMPVNDNKDIIWGNADAKQKTKIGQFLRTTSLDELPQFINVLKGDMSIVGPRPERTVFVEQFKHEIDSYMQKHLVQAGITGWAQVNGWRGDSSLKNRLEYDLFYIENWSLLFDLKIIMMTVYKGFNQGDK
jgi:putative colanic acid biosynthesis UDP-glucose lipid carrier transferase